MADRLAELSAAGVSIWLDDLSRGAITSGGLARDVAELSVVGVTTNPSIFQAAIKNGEEYAAQFAGLKGASPEEAVTAATTQDVRDACDVLRPVFDATGGKDGRVSIEVDPRLAHDTEATIAQAKELWQIVDRPNTMIKIPATIAGLPAITAVIAEGISVNVTLIFSVDRYRAVAAAYIDGLERAVAAGKDLSTIRSVASVFVSRIDAKVDPLLTEIGTAEALALRGTVAVANNRVMYGEYLSIFGSERFASLPGANAQRVLWASTGVKDPDYPDTLYVETLVAPDTVNTMPRATLEASADHLEVVGDTVTGEIDASRAVLADVERLGISLDTVFEELEAEGVSKFEDAWNELLADVTAVLEG